MDHMRNIQLDDLRPKFLDSNQRYNDYYFTVNFNHKGKEHFLKFAIVEGTLMGGSKVGLKFSRSPISLRQEEDIQVIEKPTQDIIISRPQVDETFRIEEKDDTVVVEMDVLTAYCTPDKMKIISKDDRIKGELTVTPRGPVFRWGYEKDTLVTICEGTNINGIEQLTDVQGKVTIDGEEMDIKGRGIFEHVWIKSLSFLSIRLVDWVYMNFDQMTAFITHVESVKHDGVPVHFETGTIYMIEEDDFLTTEKIDFVPENWVFMEMIRAYIPLTQKVRVKTGKGILEIQIDLSLHPQLSTEDTRRIEFLNLHNITGWNVAFYDTILSITGEFRYNEGKTVKLTNGNGVNEQIRVSSLY